MLIQNKNNLFIDQVSVEDLARSYGTPLYVYDLSVIRNHFAELRSSFLERYENTTVSYAAKAFFCKGMAELVKEENCNLDVVSGGELFVALQSGFPAKRIEFNGNNKLYEELELAIQHKVGKIIVDGLDEFAMIEEIAQKYDQSVSVLLRITPGVDAHTHDYISTAKVDSKFGFPVDEVLPLVESLKNYPHIHFRGYHFHIGSQLFENDIYLKALDAIFPLIQKTIQTMGELEELNIGGGFGIQYTNEERPSYEFFLAPVMEKITDFFAPLQKNRPNITIEPGRSIVGDAGYTIYSAGSVKNIEGVRKYVSIDGGMTDNIRPALYGAKYLAFVEGKGTQQSEETVTICGKCCESGDIIIRDISLPPISRGDLLLIPSTGAYGYSMSSNYNNLLKPAVVFVEGSHHRLVVKRQSYEQLMENDL